MRAVIVSPDYLDSARRGKLRALAGQGCAVTLAMPGGESGIDGGVRLAPIPVRGDPGDAGRQTWSRRALAALFRDVRPDLVQVEIDPAAPAAAAAATAAARLGIPVVAFSWESLPRARPWFERRRRRLTLAAATGILGGNRIAEGLLRADAPAALHATIPQFGVAMGPASPPRQGEGLAIGCIGRLIPERGVELLLRACGQLMGAWTLAILGTGPEQEPLEALAQRLGLASRLRWLGGAGRAEMEALWPELDVLVVPSRATPEWIDAFNPVLVEGMARGVVPVVTDSGALPEIVGDAGLVVTDVEALALALQQLLADPPARRALAESARSRALASYTDAAVASRTLEFWRELLAARHRQLLSPDGVVA